jgi:hypothetical protein
MRKAFTAIGEFLQTPVGVIVSSNVVLLIALFVLKINSMYTYAALGILLIVDVAAASFIRERVIYFFSQFVLPVQNPKDRQEIYRRVITIESGRGPAFFIKNGRVIMHEGEQEKRGPGTILLDTASAAVLRTDTEIKATIGPGITFMDSKEYIAGSVDLRAQLQVIGPYARDYPFFNSAWGSEETGNEQTVGQTRDGFDVSPTISIKFRIKRPVDNQPSEGGVMSRYGFDPDAVRNAITREVIQLDASQNNKSRMEWNMLPEHLVVNLWREYIRKFKLGDLFLPNGEVSKLQTIEDMINKRVKQPNVIGFDDMGDPTTEWVESIEYKQLESRGLEVLYVRIHNILFDENMERQTIENWNAEWLSNAKKEAAQLKRMEALIGSVSREEASKQLAKLITKQFSAKPTLPQQNPFKTLQLLIQPIKELALTESTSEAMEEEARKLDEVWKWLLDNNPDGGSPKGGSQ